MHRLFFQKMALCTCFLLATYCTDSITARKLVTFCKAEQSWIDVQQSQGLCASSEHLEGSGAHPASYPVGTRGHFVRTKVART